METKNVTIGGIVCVVVGTVLCLLGAVALNLAHALHFISFMFRIASTVLQLFLFVLFCFHFPYWKLEYPCVSRWQHNFTNDCLLFTTWEMHALLNELRSTCVPCGYTSTNTHSHTPTRLWMWYLSRCFLFWFFYLVLAANWIPLKISDHYKWETNISRYEGGNGASYSGVSHNNCYFSTDFPFSFNFPRQLTFVVDFSLDYSFSFS